MSRFRRITFNQKINDWVFQFRPVEYSLMKRDLKTLGEYLEVKRGRGKTAILAKTLYDHWQDIYSRNELNLYLRQRKIKDIYDLMDYTYILTLVMDDKYEEVQENYFRELRSRDSLTRRYRKIKTSKVSRRLLSEIWEELGTDATLYELTNVFNLRFMAYYGEERWEEAYEKMGIRTSHDLLNLIQTLMDSHEMGGF